MGLVIEGWHWDEHNLGHFGHGLTRAIVDQVSDGNPKFRPNRKNRSATHQMIGPDLGGGMWTVCIAETPYEPGSWVAITGWPSDTPEKDWHKRRSR